MTRKMTEYKWLSESQETIKLANWLRANDYIFTKSPNETFTKFHNVKRKNVLEGVSRGVPDMMILLKRQSLLFIELKKARTRKKNWDFKALSSDWIDISEHQTKWIEELNKIPNVQGEFSYGADEAIKLIESLEKVQKELDK